MSVEVNVSVSTDYDLCFMCCKEEVLQSIDYATMVVKVTRIIHQVLHSNHYVLFESLYF